MAISTLGGPTLGGLVEGYGSLAVAAQGDPTSLGRFGLKQIPIAGTTLQNTLLPYQGQTETAAGLAENTFQELKKLPRDQAATRVRQLVEENPALVRQLKQVAKAEALGLKTEERRLVNLGVVDGTRAKEINQHINRLKSSEEKRALVVRLVKGGILTKDVAAQLKALRQKGAL